MLANVAQEFAAWLGGASALIVVFGFYGLVIWVIVKVLNGLFAGPRETREHLRAIREANERQAAASEELTMLARQARAEREAYEQLREYPETSSHHV
ncbi:MAG: hypothetical protein AAF663_05565 [Planctomycetota bacterium]